MGAYVMEGYPIATTYSGYDEDTSRMDFSDEFLEDVDGFGLDPDDVEANVVCTRCSAIFPIEEATTRDGLVLCPTCLKQHSLEVTMALLKQKKSD